MTVRFVHSPVTLVQITDQLWVDTNRVVAVVAVGGREDDTLGPTVRLYMPDARWFDVQGVSLQEVVDQLRSPAYTVEST